MVSLEKKKKGPRQEVEAVINRTTSETGTLSAAESLRFAGVEIIAIPPRHQFWHAWRYHSPRFAARHYSAEQHLTSYITPPRVLVLRAFYQQSGNCKCKMSHQGQIHIPSARRNEPFSDNTRQLGRLVAIYVHISYQQ